jgi:phospholipase/carboxylesterase
MNVDHLIHRAGASARPTIFLHGSGGSETDLIDLAEVVAPDRPAIFLRGTLPWEDGYAFSRRAPDRSLDLADLDARTEGLAEFLTGLKRARTLAMAPVLVGYSNGAIMAETLLRRMPAQMAGAVLIRPLSPDLPSADADLSGKPVLITAGSHDERRNADDAAVAAERLRARGADVELRTYPAGHAVIADERRDIAAWLAGHFPANPLPISRQADRGIPARH